MVWEVSIICIFITFICRADATKDFYPMESLTPLTPQSLAFLDMDSLSDQPFFVCSSLFIEI